MVKVYKFIGKKNKLLDVHGFLAMYKMELDVESHNNDKERVGILLQQIAEQQEAYNTLYDRNVNLSDELTQAQNTIAAALQTMQHYSSSQ